MYIHTMTIFSISIPSFSFLSMIFFCPFYFFRRFFYYLISIIIMTDMTKICLLRMTWKWFTHINIMIILKCVTNCHDNVFSHTKNKNRTKSTTEKDTKYILMAHFSAFYSWANYTRGNNNNVSTRFMPQLTFACAFSWA